MMYNQMVIIRLINFMRRTKITRAEAGVQVHNPCSILYECIVKSCYHNNRMVARIELK
jgi:hypothetical protein